MNAIKPSPELRFKRLGESCLQIRLAGEWTMGSPLPQADDILQHFHSEGPIRRVVFDSRDLGRWDSLLLTFLIRIIDRCAERRIDVDKQGLPEGVRGLLDLACEVPERKGARRKTTRLGILAQIGAHSLNAVTESKHLLAFIGAATLGFVNLARGRASYRRVDLGLLIQDCGPQALPIVTLISLLVGLILAFVGAVQLQMFGAQIFIADLVGLGMSREMGAMMTAIIMAGRTGAAYAAQLGSMQVNEEIDALKTMGLSPMEFLVLPRMIALILMMPLLCLYADFMGILGGALVSIGMFDLSFLEYFQQTRDRLDLTDFAVGVTKSAVFGVLVAIAGCMRGLQCGRSSTAVGFAATSAVVTGIVFIIVSDSVMTLIITALHI